MKVLTVVLISTVLTSVLAGALLVNLAKANPMGYFYPRHPPPNPIIMTSPPASSTIHTFGADSVIIWFTVHVDPWIDPYGIPGRTGYDPVHEYPTQISIQCWVDGKLYAEYNWGKDRSFSASLTGLGDGLHTAEITAAVAGEYPGGVGVSKGSSGIIHFSVDTALPDVSILSAQDEMFNAADVHVNFTVSQPASWLGYSLDGKANVTITAKANPTLIVNKYYCNITLSGLPEGAHTLTVYEKDTAGNTVASQPWTFSVKTQTTEPEQSSFPTTWIVAGAVAIIAIGGVAFLVYFRRIRKTTGKANQVKERTNNTS